MESGGQLQFNPSHGNQGNNMYYSNTASSLSKRPLGEIQSEKDKKKGNKGLNPKTKKNFQILPRIDTGLKNKGASGKGCRVSDGITAKRKDELYGRLSTTLLSKFLNGKYDQNNFITILKMENHQKLGDTKGTDFNFTDYGYTCKGTHEVRLNKRPITAKAQEKFGSFTQSLFNINNSKEKQPGLSDRSGSPVKLASLLELTSQNVILVDMRGEGVSAQQEFIDYHIIGSVSFPHGWINRYNHFQALQRFRNLDNKIIIVFSDNERKGTNVAKVLSDKGFENIYLLNGGIQQFFVDYPELIEGNNMPEYYEYKRYVETSIRK